MLIPIGHGIRAIPIWYSSIFNANGEVGHKKPMSHSQLVLHQNVMLYFVLVKILLIGHGLMV